MAARSKRLGGPTRLTVSDALSLLYTCPVGKVALVKSIRLINITVNPCVARLQMSDTAPLNRLLWDTVGAGTTYVDQDTDPVVLTAGEKVYAAGVPSTGTLDLWVVLSGAELDA